MECFRALCLIISARELINSACDFGFRVWWLLAMRAGDRAASPGPLKTPVILH